MLLIARPRLHLSLADMGYASARAFGGIGFSIVGPQTVIEFQRCDRIEFEGLETLDDEARSDINDVAYRLKSVIGNNGFRAVLKSAPPQHVGFGSKTSLLLGLIAGVNALNGCNLSPGEMQQLSGRGGASGVGIHAFFNGGVVWDGGHSRYSTMRLAPSGSGGAQGIPPLMMRFPFPEIWNIVLVLPEEPVMSGEEERQFFATNAPIPRSEALMTMAILYHGILPAMTLVDYEALASSLGELHHVGFKNRELCRWNLQIRNCVDALLQHRLAAGMSSVGPLIYVIVPKDEMSVLNRVESICRALSIRMFEVVQGCNSGYEVR